MFKYKSPIALPQLTTDKFEKAHDKYVAEHGYEIHIPGFTEIVKWPRHVEPTTVELAVLKKSNNSRTRSKYYIKKLGEARFERIKTAQPGDVDYPTYQEMEDYNKAIESNNKYLSFLEILGDRRYEEIKALKQERKELYTRMLSSPSPRLARNAASVLTFIDDINDTMGTIGVVARTAHHLMNNTFLQTLLRGVGGMAFTAAELTSIVMALARNPMKAKRIQHVVHGGLNGNPPSYKIRSSVGRRFAKHGIGHGELIEAAQVSNNMFGYGLSLGPIFSLLYDIPSGIYRHMKGEEVRVTGLPRPLLWFDRIWSRNLKSLAEFSIVAEEWMDKEVGKAMVSAKMCTDMLKQMYRGESALESLPDVSQIQTPVQMPSNPLTEEVIKEETPNFEDYLNWPSTEEKWKAVLHNWDKDRDEVNDNIKNWLARNAFDQESYLCKQNAIEAGFDAASLLDGEDSTEWKFDSATQALLTTLNNNYRFPPTMQPELSRCFANLMSQYDQLNIDPGCAEIVRVSYERCGIDFTTNVPWSPGPDPLDLEKEARNTMYRLTRWYFNKWLYYLRAEYNHCQGRHIISSAVSMSKASHYYQWLCRYGFPPGEPGREMSKVDKLTSALMNYCIPDLGARLYGRYDPYTEDKVIVIIEKVKSLFPGFGGEGYVWPDGIIIQFLRRTNGGISSRWNLDEDFRQGFFDIANNPDLYVPPEDIHTPGLGYKVEIGPVAPLTRVLPYTEWMSNPPSKPPSWLSDHVSDYQGFISVRLDEPPSWWPPHIPTYNVFISEPPIRRPPWWPDRGPDYELYIESKPEEAPYWWPPDS